MKNLKYDEVLDQVQKVGKIGFWELTLESGEIFWSDHIYRIFDLDPETYHPTLESALQFYPKESAIILEDALQKAFETGVGYDLELEVLTSKGEKLWTRALCHVEFKGGKPFRVYGTIQDIDKQKKMQIELFKSQVHLGLALESAGIGNWSYYPEAGELHWDDASFEIFGVEKSSFKGKLQDWVEVLHPEDVEASQRHFQRTIENQIVDYESTFRIIHKEKGERTIRGKATIEYNLEGKPKSIHGLNWDISKEVEVQKNLIKAKEKALDATQAKSSFLASMSHEIRTPMNGMMGMLDLLSDSNLNKEQRDLVDTIQSCGDQLLTIVNDILDFSKIEAGRMDLEYRSFDLRKVIKGVRSIFEAQAMRKGIEINLIIPVDIPTHIKGDETRFKQILSNLVSNALKFTKEGSIDITVIQDKKRSSKTMGTFLFKVRDTGIGIPLKKQGNLFQSFRQVDDSTSREYGGSGLGLAICKSLVEKMGGHIGVESFPEAGSIFFFDIMAGIGEDELCELPQVPMIGFRRDLKILLAEDNRTNQKLAVSYLKKLGLEDSIYIANNGEEAMEMVLEESEGRPFDLIFMDVQMPGMDGLEATSKIISELGSEAPIIAAMTANAFDEDKKNCFEAGMKYFIPKPIKRQMLEEFLSKFFPLKNINSTHIDENNREGVMKVEKTYEHISKDKILFEFEEDFDIFEELVSDYRQQMPEFIKTLSDSIDNENGKDLKIAAHTVKGIVSNFFAEELRAVAIELEKCGTQEDFVNAHSYLNKFLKINQEALIELEDLISLHSASGQAA